MRPASCSPNRSRRRALRFSNEDLAMPAIDILQASTPMEAKDELFAADSHSADLKGKTIRGGAVTFIAQGAKVLISVGSTLLLARLLTPRDFGLISMVTGVTGFV